ncbi:MAG: hypothetical protein IT344_02000 [Candidatus Dadabacteria bacterium]|nr:hypothetical protein [Candidatus Dadabacteria bacterium]
MRILELFTAILFLSGFTVLSAYSIEFPPEQPKRVIAHAVKRAEELHLLAGYYYRDPRQWVRIYRDNAGTIRNPNRIYPGQVLYITVDRDWTPPFDLDAYVAEWGTYLLNGTVP